MRIINTKNGPRAVWADGSLHLPPIAGGDATTIEVLRNNAQKADERYQALLTQYATEMAKYGEQEPPAEEQERIEQMAHDMGAALKMAQEAKTNLESAKAWDEQTREWSTKAGRPPVDPAEVIRRGGRNAQTLGGRFATAPALQEWRKEFAAEGRVPNIHDVSGLMGKAFHFKGLGELDASTPLSTGMHAELLTGESSTSAGAFVVPDQYGPPVMLGRRPLVMRDIITNLTTESDTVEFVRQTTETNAAAPVPEAEATDADTSGAEPGTKPESAMAFERVSTPVITIAHWIPATTRALSDVSQLRGIIDAFLRDGVEQELEDQIVTGTGTGENLEGILNTSDIQDQAFTDDIFRTTRQARRKIRTVARRRPTAFVFNPIDNEEIELTRDGNNQFFHNGPFALGPQTLWGLPVIESEAVPQGTGLCGDFTRCILWDREQASISVSNSHADFFIRNLVALLCELRVAFALVQPNAVISIEMAGS